jgi:hypothetical protein
MVKRGCIEIGLSLELIVAPNGVNASGDCGVPAIPVGVPAIGVCNVPRGKNGELAPAPRAVPVPVPAAPILLVLIDGLDIDPGSGLTATSAAGTAVTCTRNGV